MTISSIVSFAPLSKVQSWGSAMQFTPLLQFSSCSDTTHKSTLQQRELASVIGWHAHEWGKKHMRWKKTELLGSVQKSVFWRLSVYVLYPSGVIPTDYSRQKHIVDILDLLNTVVHPVIGLLFFPSFLFYATLYIFSIHLTFCINLIFFFFVFFFFVWQTTIYIYTCVF